MAGPYIHDRVKDTSTTTGTGTLTLANSAPTGFRTFGSILADGATVLYAIAHQSATEWETGVGTYTASGTTLARTTVLRSSNSNNAVSFSSGTKDVFCAPIVDQADKWLNPTAAVASLSAFQAGRTGWPTDCPVLFRDSGSALLPWGPIAACTDPTLKSWTDIGTPTKSTTGPFKTCSKTSGGSAWNIHGQYYTAPSTPYTVTLGFFINVSMGSTGQAQGWVGWRSSSGTKLVGYSPYYDNGGGTPYKSHMKFPDATGSGPTAYFTQTRANGGRGGPFWVRLENDGTNLTVRESQDYGLTWIAIAAAVAKGDYLTNQDHIWYGIVPFSNDASITLFSLAEA